MKCFKVLVLAVGLLAMLAGNEVLAKGRPSHAGKGKPEKATTAAKDKAGDHAEAAKGKADTHRKDKAEKGKPEGKGKPDKADKPEKGAMKEAGKDLKGREKAKAKQRVAEINRHNRIVAKLERIAELKKDNPEIQERVKKAMEREHARHAKRMEKINAETKQDGDGED